MPPLVLINAVGLTSQWLAHAPRLQALAQRGWLRALSEVVPAVTCTTQATILTGQTPQRHGIAANGLVAKMSSLPVLGGDFKESHPGPACLVCQLMTHSSKC